MTYAAICDLKPTVHEQQQQQQPPPPPPGPSTALDEVSAQQNGYTTHTTHTPVSPSTTTSGHAPDIAQGLPRRQIPRHTLATAPAHLARRLRTLPPWQENSDQASHPHEATRRRPKRFNNSQHTPTILPPGVLAAVIHDVERASSLYRSLSTAGSLHNTIRVSSSLSTLLHDLPFFLPPSSGSLLRLVARPAAASRSVVGSYSIHWPFGGDALTLLKHSGGGPKVLLESLLTILASAVPIDEKALCLSRRTLEGNFPDDNLVMRDSDGWREGGAYRVGVRY
ncbi:hypothetical protein C8R43DRAFT_1155825 [Mycena crocata]|nr:hypothetical protein C8R43DRAFT_1155825 [Mycena crocata]